MRVAERQSEWVSRLPGLDRLWPLTTGHPGLRIAVLDGPVDRSTAPDQHAAPSGAIQHGTLVSSIIASSGDQQPGIAPGCTLLSIPIFDGRPGGELVCSQDTLAGAIREALALGAHIVNISASQQADALALTSALSDAIQEALAKDVLVVAATGNHGCACDTLPASVAGVLAVGAHDDEGAPFLMSNWGPSQRAQGILAPGVNLPGACVGGGLCRATGTSFAAAVVSGVAALLMSLDIERGLRPSGERVKRALLASCDRCEPSATETCSTYLAGRLNLRGAVEELLASSEGDVRGEESLGINETTFDGARGVALASMGEAGPEARLAGAAPSAQRRPAGPAVDGLRPADCGCGGKCNGDCSCGGHPKAPQLVYAIGRLGVSFINQARRDSIWRSLNGAREMDLKPIGEAALLGLFEREPFQAQSVIWTLSPTEVPLYAIVPTGAFAAETYRWLVEEWADGDVEFVSVPGIVAGEVTLFDGWRVEVLVPDLRGMRSWERSRLRDRILAAGDQGAGAPPPGDGNAAPKGGDPPRAAGDTPPPAAAGGQGGGGGGVAITGGSGSQPPGSAANNLDMFLGKIMYRIRNRGRTPEERALNAAVTNAYNFGDIILDARNEGLTFRDIAVEKSPLNRPGSEYYDVLLTFFDPNNKDRRALLSARFTMDVSDTVPVLIGEPVTWFEY